MCYSDPSPLFSSASRKSQAQAKRLENSCRSPVPTPPLGTGLPGTCRKEDWDAHFCSPWQQVRRAGRFHWHRHWKRASSHLRDGGQKRKKPLTHSEHLHSVPLECKSLVEGRGRKNARETIPAEVFSESRTTCGAERMKTRRERGKQKWLHSQETSMYCRERGKSSTPLPDTKCPQSRWPNYHRNPL